ncbi:hypothetical protein EFK50_07600 [Nocardioides marmoriginsengisoli]|uniref:Collagen-like protein n=2 Tax=Nocardioides marmoriginsengisoli TaxID=661483 RepID=A0A3N0CLV0_9ACTN|nr:hypothetical protein EFK50_07600 [Nocardioides marmoriginsengisoli]
MKLARRHAPAVIACTIVAIAFGATGAVAGTLITSKQIKNGTIKNVDVAQGTLTADRLTAGARAGLKGSTGARGPQGLKGEAGGETRGDIVTWDFALAPGVGVESATQKSVEKLPVNSYFRVLDVLDFSLTGAAQCTNLFSVSGPGFSFSNVSGVPDPVKEWRYSGNESVNLSVRYSCLANGGADLTTPIELSGKAVIEILPDPTYTLTGSTSMS